MPEGDWLAPPRLNARAAYPVVLDIVDLLRTRGQSAVLAAALAPTWEELGRARDDTVARFDDVQEQEDDSHERLLAAAVVHDLHRVGAARGLYLHGAEFVDDITERVLLRLARDSHDAFELALASSPTRIQHRLGLSMAAHACRELAPPRLTLRARELVALAPHGLPTDVVRTIIGTDGGTSGAWLSLQRSEALRLRRAISPRRTRVLHGQIFDAWPPSGWGYLRRAFHAWHSADPGRMYAQHRALLLAYQGWGAEFLLQQFESLAGVAPDPNLQLGLARLAPRVARRGGFALSHAAYQRALAGMTSPVERVGVLYELANSFAVRRRPWALRRARNWYRRAYEELEHVRDRAERLRGEVRLANGLALVAYHERDNDGALALERTAAAAAAELAAASPSTQAWAVALVQTNTAKLLEKRFADAEGAARLLRDNLRWGTPEARLRSAIDLARLRFDHGAHLEVVELLEHALSGPRSLLRDAQEELFARLLLAGSLQHLGRTAAALAQIERALVLGSGEADVDLLGRARAAPPSLPLASGASHGEGRRPQAHAPA